MCRVKAVVEISIRLNRILRQALLWILGGFAIDWIDCHFILSIVAMNSSKGLGERIAALDVRKFIQLLGALKLLMYR